MIALWLLLLALTFAGSWRVNGLRVTIVLFCSGTVFGALVVAGRLL